MIDETEKTARLPQKIFAAAAYATTSTLTMMVIKYLLTELHFPSFALVAMLQYMASVVVLFAQAKILSKPSVRLPPPTLNIIVDIAPVSALFFCNTLCGLGATKTLNLPIFVLFRRFSIVMTMALESALLGKRFKMGVKLSVALMIIGALVVSFDHMSFNTYGICLILLNDIFTALQGVVLRKTLDEKAERLGTSAIVFYSNLFALPLVAMTMIALPNEMEKLALFKGWDNPQVIGSLFLSAFLGFAINYSYAMCTKLNSPLTTTIIGAAKNIATSYIGMFMSDFNPSSPVLVHIGINLSMLGSLWYSRIEWLKMLEGEKHRKGLLHKADDANSSSSKSEGGQQQASPETSCVLSVSGGHGSTSPATLVISHAPNTVHVGLGPTLPQ